MRQTMTSGPDQRALSDVPHPGALRRQSGGWPRATLAVLAGLALATTYGAVRLRAEAALACRDMDAGLGFSLNVVMVFLAGVNLTGASLAWLVFGRRYGASGGLAALVVTVVVLLLTTVGFFHLIPLPDLPLPGCPRGEPPWWPSWLPG
jgi:hypothetical protein